MTPEQAIRKERLTQLDTDSQDSRRPYPLLSLIGAQHERIHRDPGHARAAMTAQRKEQQ